MFYFGPKGAPLAGDVKFTCHHNKALGKSKLFTCWIHTLFAVDGVITLDKGVLDSPHKDKYHKVQKQLI